MGASSFSFLETTIEEIQQAIQKGTLTSLELVEWYIERIQSFNQSGPELNAIVNVNEKARQEAVELDRYFKVNGQLKGPLHGVPVLVKDQAETKGIPTTFGSSAFKEYVPKSDATLVEKLREAGAIILAKTSMCDFAAGWFSFSSVTGQTKNPYALNREAGGSSAGTSCGITSNFGAVGIGEDTGGSIRIPSSFNNLFGLRVTTGLISRFGFSPLVHFQDSPGPITRTVRDMAKLLDVIVGYDEKDPFTAAAIQARDAGKYEELLKHSNLEGRRIGILRSAFGPDNDDSRPVNQVIESVIERLKAAGAVIVDSVEIPELDRFLEETSMYTLQSKKDITRFLSSRENTPLKSFMEVYNAKAFHPLNDLFHDIADGPEEPAEQADYYRQRFAQEEFRRTVMNVLASYEVEALLFPDVKVLPPTYEELHAEKWSCLTFPTNTTISSQTGLPSMSVPGGFTPDGIPVGFELLGTPFSEASLLQLAYAYEKLAKPRKPPVLPEKIVNH
ncbi:amidase [Domibacillus indicus]|uniref:amidase n=1 Tax=Domibacillus indicus TaxID=1437523 RepID=UPI00203BAB2D|nr:amidase [Domibacillus indicus]MCM3790324.1 amidase [Domibacillus indicus]